MISTRATRKALKIARKAHRNQKDKAGQDYILHPLTVAEAMTTEEETVAALLHDVIEDTEITFEYLKRKKIDTRVLVALWHLTHKPEIPYFDYIERISLHPIASKVKLADLQHNSDMSRLPQKNPVDLERMQKYLTAEAMIQSVDWQSHKNLSSKKFQYFRTEKSTILKVEDGILISALATTGEWVPAQSLISIWANGEPIDTVRLPKKLVQEEQAFLQSLQH